MNELIRSCAVSVSSSPLRSCWRVSVWLISTRRPRLEAFSTASFCSISTGLLWPISSWYLKNLNSLFEFQIILVIIFTVHRYSNETFNSYSCSNPLFSRTWRCRIPLSCRPGKNLMFSNWMFWSSSPYVSITFYRVHYLQMCIFL